mmetsp:Transcript_13200/g.43741  ORF Transcript_13200/g.43741 Transcript_13200/m.43741 type:complete len:217 (+) Transcript_13200:1765-2415(+)
MSNHRETSPNSFASRFAPWRMPSRVPRRSRQSTTSPWPYRCRLFHRHPPISVPTHPLPFPCLASPTPPSRSPFSSSRAEPLAGWQSSRPPIHAAYPPQSSRLGSSANSFLSRSALERAIELYARPRRARVSPHPPRDARRRARRRRRRVVCSPVAAPFVLAAGFVFLTPPFPALGVPAPPPRQPAFQPPRRFPQPPRLGFPRPPRPRRATPLSRSR